jgi:CarD family transcriptional regulator
MVRKNKNLGRGTVKSKATRDRRKKASALRAGRRVEIRQQPAKRAAARKQRSVREKSKKMVKLALVKAAKAVKKEAKAKALKASKGQAKVNVKVKVKVAAKTVTPAKLVKEVKEQFVYKPGDYVVYPTHGVGKVLDIESTEIAGYSLKLFVISFDRDRMTLRVPVAKASTSGLRKLSTRKIMDDALGTLKGRARVKRSMWSRRAQEYEAKINSGDPISIAEVVRDLHRSAGQPDQSFSERQIYESARDRLACELAAVERWEVERATEKLVELLDAA